MVIPNFRKIILIALACIASKVIAQEYTIENFADEQALAESYIYTFAQDELGYLWIGTADGLFKHNGFTFIPYTINDSLADNFISCSYKTSQGIWFGHSNGNLSFYNGSAFQKIIINSNTKSSVTCIDESADGRLWASSFSDGFINLIDNKTFKFYPFKEDAVSVFTFCFLSDNTFLTGSDDGLRYCSISEKGKVDVLQHFSEIPRTRIQSILKKKSGQSFYIATVGDGIFQLSHNNGKFDIVRINTDPKLSVEGIQSIIEDNRQNLWIATFGSGLCKLTLTPQLDIKQLSCFNMQSGLGSDNIKVIYTDKDENIWAGCYGTGIVKLTAQTFSYTSFDGTLYGKSVTAIAEDKNHRWIGTGKGLIKADKASNRIIKHYSLEQGLPGGEISALYTDNKGALWIGTGNGLYFLNAKTGIIAPCNIHEGILENSITAITGKNNQLWVGTKKGACTIDLTSGNTKWYTMNQGGLPHNSVKHIFIDSRNTVWISTLSNTLFSISNNQTKKIVIQAENGNVTLESIGEDLQGNIWTGSAGKGLFLLHGDSIINITSKQGLFSNYCYSITGDNNGNLWIGHRGGLSRIRTEDFSIKTIQKNNGINKPFNFNKNASIRCVDGKLCFGSDNGLFVYNPELENTICYPPTVSITSVMVNNEEFDIKDKIAIPPGRYKITINYIGISLKEPDKVSYQYRLKGYDDEWSDITHNTTVSYAGLLAGTYIFELNASNSDGITTKNPIRIEFIIKSPLWKRWWIYFLIIVVLGTVGFIYVKSREYVHISERRKLEEKVNERTVEIQQQKDEIERQRDIINRKNKDITDSLKYARKLQSAIIPPEELLEKLFPENFLINKPKDIVSGDFCWYTQTLDKIIITVADCTGHGVPGAIMSILGINSLNEIIINYGVLEPSRILELLRLKVVSSLSQHSKESPSFDGINLGICVIDQKTYKVQFAGAINNMVHIQDNTLNVIKADRIPIGVSDLESVAFTEIEFQGKKGDLLYLYSDGFQDQFGGVDDKKYSSRRFINTLLNISEKPMNEQKDHLELILKRWMGDREQTDDITILGVRL